MSFIPFPSPTENLLLIIPSKLRTKTIIQIPGATTSFHQIQNLLQKHNSSTYFHPGTYCYYQGNYIIFLMKFPYFPEFLPFFRTHLKVINFSFSNGPLTKHKGLKLRVGNSQPSKTLHTDWWLKSYRSTFNDIRS